MYEKFIIKLSAPPPQKAAALRWLKNDLWLKGCALRLLPSMRQKGFVPGSFKAFKEKVLGLLHIPDKRVYQYNLLEPVISADGIRVVFGTTVTMNRFYKTPDIGARRKEQERIVWCGALVYELRTRKLIAALRELHIYRNHWFRPVFSLALDSKGERILMKAEDVSIIDIATGEKFKLTYRDEKALLLDFLKNDRGARFLHDDRWVLLYNNESKIGIADTNIKTEAMNRSIRYLDYTNLSRRDSGEVIDEVLNTELSNDNCFIPTASQWRLLFYWEYEDESADSAAD
jgi:hypothetical protein